MAGPDSQSSLHTGMHSLVESYLDVLTRVLLAQPEAFTNIISGGPQAHERFLDNWIHVASVRCNQGAASAVSDLLGLAFAASARCPHHVCIGRFTLAADASSSCVHSS